VEFLKYKLKYKLHMLKKVPWRWPTIKVETCWSINQQIKVLCNNLVLNFT